ncbi:MAG: hypothetical protein ACOVOX_12210, partial [Burkholderiaceae bacterium]
SSVNMLVPCSPAAKADAAALRDPTKAPGHYAALKAGFEKEFPELKLSYLIEYGVYGLVNSKLK